MAAGSLSSSWQTWLLNFLCTGNATDDAYILKVINNESIDSLRQLSDGDVMIKASFSKAALKKLQNFHQTSDVVTRENLALQLQKFTLRHALHKQMEKCEFRLHVDSCELMQMDLDFLSDDDAQNCMTIASVRRKSKDLWKKSEIKNCDTCTDGNITSSQLLRCMEEDSNDAPDRDGYTVRTIATVTPKQPVASANQTVPQQSPVRRTTSEEEFYTPNSSPRGKGAPEVHPRMFARVQLATRQLQPTDFIIPTEQERPLAIMPDWRLQAQYGTMQGTHQSKDQAFSRFASPRSNLNAPPFQSQSRPAAQSQHGQSTRRSLAYFPGKPQPSGSRDGAHRPTPSHVNPPGSVHSGEPHPSTSHTAAYKAQGPSAGVVKQFTFKKPSVRNHLVLTTDRASAVGDTTLAGLGDDFTVEQSQGHVTVQHGKHHDLSKPSSTSVVPGTKSVNTDVSHPRWQTTITDTQRTSDDAESLVFSMDDEDFSQLTDIPFSVYSQSQRANKRKTAGLPPSQQKSQKTSHEVVVIEEGNTQDGVVSTDSAMDVLEIPSSDEHTSHGVSTGFHLSVPDIAANPEQSDNSMPLKMPNKQTAFRAWPSVQDDEAIIPTTQENTTAGRSARFDTWTCQSQSSDESQKAPGSPEVDELDLELLRIASEQLQAKEPVVSDAPASTSTSQDGQAMFGSTQGEEPSTNYLKAYTQWLDAQDQLQGTEQTGFDPNIMDSNEGMQPSQEVTHSTQLSGTCPKEHRLLPDLNLSPVRCLNSNHARSQRMSSSPKLQSPGTRKAGRAPPKETLVHSQNEVSDDEHVNSCSLLSKHSDQSGSARSPDIVLCDSSETLTQVSKVPGIMAQKQCEQSSNGVQTSRFPASFDKKKQPDVSVLFPAVGRPTNVGIKGKRKLYNMDTVLEEGRRIIGTEPASDDQLFDTDDGCVDVPKQKKLKLDHPRQTSSASRDDTQDTMPSQSLLSGSSKTTRQTFHCRQNTNDVGKTFETVRPVQSKGNLDSRRVPTNSVTRKEKPSTIIHANKTLAAKYIRGFVMPSGKKRVFAIPPRLNRRNVTPIYKQKTEPPQTDTASRHSGSSTSSLEPSVLIPDSIPTPVNSFPANQRAMLRQESETSLEVVPAMDELNEKTAESISESSPAHSPLGDSSLVIHELQNYLVKENVVPDRDTPLHRLSFPRSVQKFIKSYFTRKAQN